MDDVARWFAPGGGLARALPAFEPRPQQARMAAEVAEALRSGRHLLVEAGTGVGKSIAYLVPAILWAVREADVPPEERRVVVSTHTRALQEQLARKDLPFLERALGDAGISFRHALLMGGDNYLCVQRLREATVHAALPGSDGAPALLAALTRHAAAAGSGLRGEIPFQVPSAVWSAVRRDRDLCLGPRGPFWDDCLYRRDLARAREAHILVVNHALFFLDLATGQRVLPPHAAVILDEAHRAEEVAASQFGVAVSRRSLAALASDVAGARGAARDVPAVAEAAARLEAAAARLFADLAAVAADLAARRGERGGPPRPEAQLLARLTRPGMVEDVAAAPLLDLEGAIEAWGGRSDTAEAGAAAALAARARDLRGRIGLLVQQRMQDAVYWIESPAGRGAPAARLTLQAAPIEVAQVLRPRLFEGARRVILTSATLTAAGSFAHLRGRLGIAAASEVALGSPYDYTRQALLYLPDRMPDPVASPEPFAEAIVEECRRLLRVTGGGAFILFTSYALLNRVHAALLADRGLAHLTFFRHEPGVASSILEEFRMTRRGVLLGTLTFWQGVDVPGDALRAVILTRLPFETPDHPVAEARAETIRGRGGDPFSEDSLPEAILTFRQGFGRLIRGREDRGLVAALDPRLRTRPYGAAFLESLPDCRRASTIEEVERFFPAEDAGG